MENRFLAILAEGEKARKGLAFYALLVIGLSAASFAFSESILLFLVRLLNRKLVAYDPSEGFFALLSIALYCGLALSLPAGAWMLWRGAFVPRLPAWKRWGWIVIGTATGLFFLGMLLGYLVLLPAGVGFLVGFESEEVRALISARKFVSFCGTMLLALGLSFEAPLVSYFLAKAGWLTPGFFRNKWRQAILGCVVVSAVLTPTPDIYNLTLMTIPLLGLFLASFAVVWVVDRGKKA
ncbi:MAG TPA: twin-arginine translocase subunit TatC [Candidatus Limnocylindria bacterium]|nr:twin-arginine translocase subunit TatC [Candidatus Limnocylindria bacterium]